jgi:hypothetical protein
MRDRISIRISKGVADVRLVRADKMNAIDAAMFHALVAASDRLAMATALAKAGAIPSAFSMLMPSIPCRLPDARNQAAASPDPCAGMDAASQLRSSDARRLHCA